MEDDDASAGDMQKVNRVPAKETGLAALITPEAADILGLAEGSLGVCVELDVAAFIMFDFEKIYKIAIQRSSLK